MTELIDQCLLLPKKERRKLVRLLQDSLIEIEDDGSRFHTLYVIATRIVGEGILTQRRDLNLVLGRRMIARQMRNEGYSLTQIGKPLHKHHASVMHMLAMWDDAMELQFREETLYWKEFQKQLKEYEEEISGKVVSLQPYRTDEP